MEKKYLKCQECGKEDETVSKLFCGYAIEIGNTEVEEIICDNCEHEHLMDI